MSAKYVVFNVDNKELAVVFSPDLEHKEVRVSTEFGECAPVSAGHCLMINGEVMTEGESKGLLLSPRPQDAELLRKVLTTIHF